jgi:hypothetical protein
MATATPDAPVQMAPDAKRALKNTIRELREVLLTDLREALDRTYRLSLRVRDTGLGEAAGHRRERLESWISEQLRAQNDGRTRDDFLREVEKQAAYTLLNRIVVLRLVEERRPPTSAVIRGGWNSAGYADFRALARALALPAGSGGGDETEGYGFLLQLVFEEMSVELPGIFGPVGIADLVPTPPRVLRAVVEALDNPALATCWSDDMTLGWVYQYWNDPERERLDAKLNSKTKWGSGKIERHEIASKTQMFTERYMVDWLLQNSLGPMWLATCRRRGWTASAESDGTLARLEERRVEWRGKRDKGEVSLTALMPLHTQAERQWAYYVPQIIPEDAVAHAPETVRNLKILDPAVGSGHFLVVAFDLLLALYHEEARHRAATGPEWSERAIVERILEYNLYGIDLDPRAIQIAAAALWLKAQAACPEAHPRRLNLVSSNLRLARLPKDDPALVELREGIERETGLPASLTDTLVQALHGADHLGSLLRIDAAVEDALDQHDAGEAVRARPDQGQLFGGFSPRKEALPINRAEVRASVVERLQSFLASHTSSDDVGLRLRGEQLAAGVRFVRMLQEETYDLVAANPPYQGTSKMKDTTYVRDKYQRGGTNLFAAFLERGLELVRPGGYSAMLTMRNWMFIQDFSALRAWLNSLDLRAIGDFDRGAFELVPDEVVSVAATVFRRADRSDAPAVAMLPTALDDQSRDSERTQRKKAATLDHRQVFRFRVGDLAVVQERPLIYWWSQAKLTTYATTPKIGSTHTILKGLTTCNNPRFVRYPHEVSKSAILLSRNRGELEESAVRALTVNARWVPWIDGAAGRIWFEELSQIVNWRHRGLEIATAPENRYGRGEEVYFQDGVAFSMIGSQFSARRHRWRSIIGNMGASIFGANIESLVCFLNSSTARRDLQSLNPTNHFEKLDVQRLALDGMRPEKGVISALDRAFTEHESHRESSVEFTSPGSSPWRHAQEWAQTAVDRPEGAPAPEYSSTSDPELSVDHLSFALGAALGRFDREGGGILDPSRDDLTQALPAGILFLDGTLSASDHRDSLGSSAAQILHTTWATHGQAIDPKATLREYLRTKFFALHRSERMYDNRPIHWPLSSKDKTFVAWVNIHRISGQTLRVLLADHLQPTLTRVDGELNDLRAAKEASDRKAANAADKRYSKLKPLRDELDDFIRAVSDCGEKGPPIVDACPPRETDERYAPDLDDGVMINSAALWPLLDPQWKNPKTWWKELSTAAENNDYDWAHLAMRYWPARVDKKCRKGGDPSLAVAHGCFWKYHPERAWAWELRLQDEIAQDFRIKEAPYRPEVDGDAGDVVHREAWLRDHAEAALAAIEKEVQRRRRKRKAAQPSLTLLETGLWTHEAGRCFALELRVSEKQGTEFRLLSPDEPEARANFVSNNPAEVTRRAQLLSRLRPTHLFGAGDSTDEHEKEPGDEAEEEAAV